MPTIAGEPVTLAEVRGTLSMLRYYRAFLRSDPRKYGECTSTAHVRSLRDALFWGGTMNRDETRRWLGYIVNMAINRKAGIPDDGRRSETRTTRFGCAVTASTSATGSITGCVSTRWRRPRCASVMATWSPDTTSDSRLLSDHRSAPVPQHSAGFFCSVTFLQLTLRERKNLSKQRSPPTTRLCVAKVIDVKSAIPEQLR